MNKWLQISILTVLIMIIAMQPQQMFELYYIDQDALEKSGDILPVATHQISKAYKAARLLLLMTRYIKIS